MYWATAKLAHIPNRWLCLAAGSFVATCWLLYHSTVWPYFVVRKGALTAPVRLAIVDDWGLAHDEVIGPLLYTLSNIDNVETTVYRDTFRKGFPEMVQTWYSGPYHTYNSFYEADLTQIDVVLLTTADHDIDDLLGKHDVLNRHPHLRVIAVAHRSPAFDTRSEGHCDWRHLNATSTRLLRALHQGRGSFLTLSPHVQKSLQGTLSASFATDYPNVEVLVPIAPVETVKTLASESPRLINRAIIQGSLNTWSRDYPRIFRSLRKQIKRDPASWGYKVDARGTFLPLQQAENIFKLVLMGNKHKNRVWVPPALRHVVEMHRAVPYPDFYAHLAQADMLLPAFKETMYLNTAASGSIPSALMAHIPILLTKDERIAYGYLEDPAIILRLDGEDEIQAIARLRATGAKIGGHDSAWKQYEQKVVNRNRDTLIRMLWERPNLDGIVASVRPR